MSGYIRVDKINNKIDTSRVIFNLEDAKDIELLQGWEWELADSPWCIAYEMKELRLVEKKIKYFSQLAFDKRSEEIAEYRLINASLGVYDAQETERIKLIVERYRNEFYRLEALCKAATTAEELESIQENYNGNI